MTVVPISRPFRPFRRGGKNDLGSIFSKYPKLTVNFQLHRGRVQTGRQGYDENDDGGDGRPHRVGPAAATQARTRVSVDGGAWVDGADRRLRSCCRTTGGDGGGNGNCRRRRTAFGTALRDRWWYSAPVRCV